jgi:acetolactate synthase-1/2/3 large subunit
LTALLPFIEGKTHESWHKFKELYEIELEAVIKVKPKKEGISMETIEMINKHSKGDAIMVSDVGQHQMFTCRYAKFNSSKVMLLWRIRNDGIWQLGAKMGMPNREVVAVIGDGGFQMTIQN